MSQTDSVFQRVVSKLLTEIFNGPAGAEAYINPWADADWNGSWRRTTVTDDQWRMLRDSLRKKADTWQRAVAVRTEWDDINAAAALSTIAHTAYHLGAIRQILGALR